MDLLTSYYNQSPVAPAGAYVLDIARFGSTQTNDSTLKFAVIFNSGVSNVAASDFVVTGGRRGQHDRLCPFGKRV